MMSGFASLWRMPGQALDSRRLMPDIADGESADHSGKAGSEPREVIFSECANLKPAFAVAGKALNCNVIRYELPDGEPQDCASANADSGFVGGLAVHILSEGREDYNQKGKQQRLDRRFGRHGNGISPLVRIDQCRLYGF